MVKIKLACILFGISAAVGIMGNLYAHNNTEAAALTQKQKSLIVISACTARGNLEQLRTALHAGLEAGWTVNEIKEMLIHLYAYCGFPRSIRGLQTFMEVLDERKAKGIIDPAGREASLIHDARTKYERGASNLAKLTGQPQTGPAKGYAEFAPIIDIFLKEHLFADLFERDILRFAERELVTISVLSSIGGVEPMLRSHLSICLNLGFTPEQLNEFTATLKSVVGEKEYCEAQAIIAQFLSGR